MPLTQDQLLAVVDRVVDDAYLDPLKVSGPGYELYQGSAKVAERCSVAVSNFEQDIYILSSKAGVLATVPVTFYRDNAAAGAGSILAGSLVRASRGGQTFRVRDSVAFGPSDLTVTTTGVAVGYGYEWNIKGPFIDRDNVSWPGDLDTIDLLLQDPVFFDPSIRVRNDADSDGLGRPRTLDILGAERTLRRQPGEDDVNYRIRIRTLPDTVSPAAIKRQLANYFRRFPDVSYRHIETWQHEYQECYDAPDLPPTPSQNYDSTLFCYDDPRPSSPFRNRWLGEIDYLGAFYVEITSLPSMDEFSMAYDDPAADSVGTPPTAAVRALSAYDVPDTLVAPARPPAFDGVDFGIGKFLSGLFALLDETKAGGVYVAIVEAV